MIAQQQVVYEMRRMCYLAKRCLRCRITASVDANSQGNASVHAHRVTLVWGASLNA